MTWVKIDDQLHAHPKVQRAWHQHRAALALHLLALSHAGAYLTDGLVSEEFVRDRLPRPGERRRVLDVLTTPPPGFEHGLWEQTDSGLWQIHDYLDCNPSREHMQSVRPSRGRRRAQAGAGAPGRGPTPDPFKASSSHPSIEGAPA